MLDEICLPPQSQHVQVLQFTPVESHFYRKQVRRLLGDSAVAVWRLWDDECVGAMVQAGREVVHVHGACPLWLAVHVWCGEPGSDNGVDLRARG